MQDKCTGWTRLERFAIAMTYPTLTKAAAAIGINRTTLIEQLHHLENDVGTTFFHRAGSNGQPHRPTRRGTALLQTLARVERFGERPEVSGTAHRLASWKDSGPAERTITTATSLEDLEDLRDDTDSTR